MTKCKCGNISQHSKDNAGGICDACYVKENTKKCLYCDNTTTDETVHFQSYCCKRGMCDDCFNGLVGTMEQYQIDGGEEEEYSDQVAEAEKHGYSYLCYDHMKKNTELAN